MPKTEYYDLTSADSVPASESGTGTYNSAGKRVTGTGTNFTILREGDYLVSSTEERVIRIERILSDTTLILEESFPNNVSGDDFDYVKATKAKIILLSIGAKADDVKVDGTDLAEDDAITVECSEIDKKSGVNFVHPVYVSTAVKAKVLYQLL